MKKLLIVLLLSSFILLSVSCAVFPAPQPDETTGAESTAPAETQPPEPVTVTLKVGSYNIKNADGGTKLDEMAGEIKEYNLGIVGLQEVDVEVPRSKMYNIARELSERSGMGNFEFRYSIPYKGGYYGNAVISAYPIKSCERIFLESGKEEQRALLHCVIEIDGVEINFFSTHLSTQEALRPNQFRKINEIISQNKPFILVGDFNIKSFSEYNLLENVTMANMINNNLPTFQTGKSIDNIIVSDDFTINSTTVSKTGYSDHYMLVSELTLTIQPGK